MGRRRTAIVGFAVLTLVFSGCRSGDGNRDAPSRDGAESTSTTSATAREEQAPLAGESVVTIALVGDRGTVSEPEIVAVKRRVPATQAVLRAALEQLFLGPTDEERGDGHWSLFPTSTTMLRSVVIDDAGSATVDLSRSEFERVDNIGTTTGSATATRQLATTVFQFPTIKRVTFALDGDPVAYCNHLQYVDDCNPMTRDEWAR